MSTVAPAVEPVAPARTSGLAAIFEHTRYVLGENRVTAFAFGLLIVIVFAALFGPYVVPYDPLASNTAQALKPPSAAHWFGTDQLGRDILSRVVVATRLDLFLAGASGFPACRPASLAACPSASCRASPTPSWRFRCSCWPWASLPRSATRCRTSFS